MPTLDRVIRGATLYDGTGSPARSADLGIAGDRIAAIGPDLSAPEIFDANGLAAAPGFIDTHSHSDLKVLSEPLLEPKLRQGITLELFGQDGISVAPLRERDAPGRRRQLAGLLSDPPVSWRWRTVTDYLDEVDRAQPALDCAYLVPHGAVRESIIGLDDRKATDEELQKMQALLDEGLRQGAYGLSTGLIYPPCCYSDLRELVALCTTAAKHRSPIVVHLRSESDRLLEALEELFEVGRQSGVHVHLSHFKIAGKTNWPKLDQVIAAVEAATKQGVKVTADQYPYIAGSTMMGAILPPWVHSGGADAAINRLKDPSARTKIRQQLEDPSEVDWDNFWKWSGPEGILISDIPSGRRASWVGRSIKQVADEEKHDPLELALDLLRDERLGVAMVSFSQSEDVEERLMKLPYVNACTDGLLGGRPHPRAFGSYPRILGRFVREKKTLPLEEAIRKLSGLAADSFGFSGHGYLKVGARANVVLFDPATVQDTATFEQPLQFPKGLPHVMVGGQWAVRDGLPTGSRRGGALRRPAAAPA
jgi:N-acyl-D-amino-acid deacylase